MNNSELPIPSKDVPTRIGDPQGLCDTTMTERFANPWCVCETYPRNLGPCKAWEKGGNERCVYCDHGLHCHLQVAYGRYAV